MNTILESPVRSTAPAPDTDPSAEELAGGAAIPQVNLGNTIRKSWPFNLDAVRVNTAPYGERVSDLLTQSFLWCIDPTHPVSLPDFARQVGSAQNTLYKIFTGKYKHPTEGTTLPPSRELVASIARWLDSAHESFRLGTEEFIVTPLVKRVLTLCKMALDGHSSALLFGPSHIGKTWALKYGAVKNFAPESFYARMPSVGGRPGMVNTLARAVGCEPSPTMFATVRSIIGALSRRSVFIVDEVHELGLANNRLEFVKCLEVLREIHDESGCAMILSFTLINDVTTLKATLLQQFWRRAIWKDFLSTMPARGDVAAILGRHGLEFPDSAMMVKVKVKDGRREIEESPYQVLRQVAKAEALKAVCERIRYGLVLAKKREQKLSWAHFIEAHLIIAKNAEPEGDWDVEG